MGAGIALGFDYPQLRKGRTTQGQTGQNRWFCGEVCPSQESKSARLEILSECKRLISSTTSVVRQLLAAPTRTRMSFDIEHLDANRLLEQWRWLCTESVTLIARNGFGDLFLRTVEGKVLRLKMGDGTLAEVAESESSFKAR
jgi:hypothetical protein